MRRAEVKRLVASGTLTVTEVIRLGETSTCRMRIRHLLLAVPGWGTVKVAKAMRDVRISDAKTIEGMSDRQRDELVRYLAGR